MARALVAGRQLYPTQGTQYRAPTAWLPPLPARFGEVVDHVSQLLTARPATAEMKRAASVYTGVAVSTRIAKPTDLHPYRIAKMLSVVLDSPAHMSR